MQGGKKKGEEGTSCKAEEGKEEKSRNLMNLLEKGNKLVEGRRKKKGKQKVGL